MMLNWDRVNSFCYCEDREIRTRTSIETVFAEYIYHKAVIIMECIRYLLTIIIIQAN